jgi:thiamine pyrophosphate-dependent acetolactate synthase large subunit-like protein
MKNEEAAEQTERLAADLIVEQLIEWGVKYVYGIPGETTLRIVDAIRRRSDKIRFVLVRHEEVAAFMASAYAKLTGELGVCLAIAGPGATNLVTGLYDAKMDNAPVLALTGQVALQFLGQGNFQEIDQHELFDAVADYNNLIDSPEQVTTLMTLAMKHAVVEGSVAHLGVPVNVQALTVLPNAKTAGKEGRLPDMRLMPHAELIDAAKRVVYGADLMLVVGCSYSDKTAIPSRVKQVQIDLDPMMIGRKFPVHVGLVGDAAMILPVLLDRITEKHNDAFINQVAEIKKRWELKKQTEIDSDTPPARGPQIMHALQELVDPDAIIANDVGDNTLWFARNFVATNQQILMSGYVASMGFGLPAALAAQLTYPKRQVVCTTGDGGFTMVMGDFATAVANDLPLTVVLLNNAKLAMIENEQDNDSMPHFATDLQRIDFARYADACGGEGLTVDDPRELNDTLKNALSSKRPTLVDIITDPRRRWP